MPGLYLGSNLGVRAASTSDASDMAVGTGATHGISTVVPGQPHSGAAKAGKRSTWVGVGALVVLIIVYHSLPA